MRLDKETFETKTSSSFSTFRCRPLLRRTGRACVQETRSARHGTPRSFQQSSSPPNMVKPTATFAILGRGELGDGKKSSCHPTKQLRESERSRTRTLFADSDSLHQSEALKHGSTRFARVLRPFRACMCVWHVRVDLVMHNS